MKRATMTHFADAITHHQQQKYKRNESKKGDKITSITECFQHRCVVDET